MIFCKPIAIPDCPLGEPERLLEPAPKQRKLLKTKNSGSRILGPRLFICGIR
jgi:hypothetical protein